MSGSWVTLEKTRWHRTNQHKLHRTQLLCGTSHLMAILHLIPNLSLLSINHENKFWNRQWILTKNLHNQWDKLLQEGIYFPVALNQTRWNELIWHGGSLISLLSPWNLFVYFCCLRSWLSLDLFLFSVSPHLAFTRFTQPETDSELKDKIRLDLWCSSVGMGWQVSKTEIVGLDAVWSQIRTDLTRALHKS